MLISGFQHVSADDGVKVVIPRPTIMFPDFKIQHHVSFLVVLWLRCYRVRNL